MTPRAFSKRSPGRFETALTAGVRLATSDGRFVGARKAASTRVWVLPGFKSPGIVPWNCGVPRRVFGGGRLRGVGGILLDGFHAGLITLAGWRTIVSRASPTLLFPGLAFKDKASAFNRRES